MEAIILRDKLNLPVEIFKFKFDKIFQTFPKAVRMRTNKGSLIGKVIYK